MTLIRHQVRALCILRSFERTALYPVPLEAIHTVHYLADALSSVWNLPVLEDVVLRTEWVPRSGDLHEGLDELIARGMVNISRVAFAEEGERLVLQADYSLNRGLCSSVFNVIDRDHDWSYEYSAIREISSSVVGMGRDRLARAVLDDASYSDPQLDYKTLLDLEPDAGERPSRTVLANDQMSEIAVERLGHPLTAAELTNLYVRHLYRLSKEDA